VGVVRENADLSCSTGKVETNVTGGDGEGVSALTNAATGSGRKAPTVAAVVFSGLAGGGASSGSRVIVGGETASFPDRLLALPEQSIPPPSAPNTPNMLAVIASGVDTRRE
jgi:hypothetical protein